MTPIDLHQAPLMDVLRVLADKGTIRQLDYQFARFIAQQASGYSARGQYCSAAWLSCGCG